MIDTQRIYTTQEPHVLAEEIASRYFAALAAEVPFDAAPGDVNLIDAFNRIEDALRERETTKTIGEDHALAMNAGYLLGIAIGRRMR